jgi:branched-chain amino acid transport system permease protein
MAPDAIVQDRDVLVENRFNVMQRTYLKTLVTDELVEEHRRQPLGQHSEPLQRVLHYFRQTTIDRYALKRDAASGAYRLVVLPNGRGGAPRFLDDAEYNTVDAAYHGLFLKQLKDMLGS